jgi:hypothetical protein
MVATLLTFAVADLDQEIRAPADIRPCLAPLGVIPTEVVDKREPA